MQTQPYLNEALLGEPLPVSCAALDSAYALNSQLTLKVLTHHQASAKMLTFSNRKTVGEAADEAAKEFGVFMPSPTFMDPSGHVHRRETGMVCMINGETLQLVNID